MLVADHYPTKSIKDIDTDRGVPWDKAFVILFGEKISLNTLENDYIRNNYDKPRVHFALVCSALGCPPILNTSYESELLEEQLETQTRLFLSDKEKNSIDIKKRVIRLSPIFDWYKEDYVTASGSLITYVKPYFDNQARSDFDVGFTDYNWSLNHLPAWEQ